MITGFFRANKENILYTILTIFLLERVRRGWNRIAERGKIANTEGREVESRQHTFMFVAALLYAVPFVLPIVRYVYRSIDELAQYVNGLSALSSTWVFAGIVVLVELFLAVVIYNILGIYVERMNAALGFFRKIGRSVVDGSRVAVQAGASVPVRVAGGIRGAVVETVHTGRYVVAACRGMLQRSRPRVRPALESLKSRLRTHPVRPTGEPHGNR
jgi:hypothetical protein